MTSTLASGYDIPGGVDAVIRSGGDSPVEYPDYDNDEQQQPKPFDLEAVNRRLAALGSGQP
jgi:hypothetical protein